MSQTVVIQTPNAFNYFQGSSFTAPLLAQDIMKYDIFVTMRDTEEILDLSLNWGFLAVERLIY